jgi:hypothetical protein
MTEAQQFEELKSNAMKDYSDYLNAINDFSYEDLKNLNKRLQLLNIYNKSVFSNASYRKFINEYKSVVQS